MGRLPLSVALVDARPVSWLTAQRFRLPSQTRGTQWRFDGRSPFTVAGPAPDSHRLPDSPRRAPCCCCPAWTLSTARAGQRD